MTVTLFIPCFRDALLPRAGISMVEILERLGHKVVCPEEIVCCGQPPFNSGYWDEARAVCGKVLVQLQDAEVIVIGSGSCGAMLKNFYPELFKDTPQLELAKQISSRTWEFSEFLVKKLGVTDLGAAFPHKVTFHDGCHGLRELGVKKSPRELLGHVRGLPLFELPDALASPALAPRQQTQDDSSRGSFESEIILTTDGHGLTRIRAGKNK